MPYGRREKRFEERLWDAGRQVELVEDTLRRCMAWRSIRTLAVREFARTWMEVRGCGVVGEGMPPLEEVVRVDL